MIVLCGKADCVNPSVGRVSRHCVDSHFCKDHEQWAWDHFFAWSRNIGEIADLVNSPPHYTDGGIETIDFIEAKGLGYHLGNCIKYISRAGKKGDGVEDLKKAQWYLNRYIAKLEEDNEKDND